MNKSLADKIMKYAQDNGDETMVVKYERGTNGQQQVTINWIEDEEQYIESDVVLKYNSKQKEEK